MGEALVHTTGENEAPELGIEDAWACVLDMLVGKSFKKCSICNELDIIETGYLLDSNPDEMNSHDDDDDVKSSGEE